MRHIQIKLSLILVMILLSVSGYGQMQQVLRNGFVAATNNGIYYLQEGFNEWVKLGVPYYDLVTTVSFNKTELGSFGSNSSYTVGQPLIVYGNKLSIGWTYSSGQSNAMSTNKFKKTHSQADAIKYNDGSLSSIHFSFGFNSSHWLFSSSNQNIWRTDIVSDNDSIFIVVGKNNTLRKYTVNYSLETVTENIISGLSSNVVSGHKICYDSNNDLFWVVSDEGRIYTYNKTTLTYTGRTLPRYYDGNYWDIINVSSIVHTVNGYLYFYVEVSYNSQNAHVFYTINDEFIGPYKQKLRGGVGVINSSFMCEIDNGRVLFSYFYNQIGIDYNPESDQFRDVPSLPEGTIIYDLDYINYSP